jgi:hypothetical protein
LISSVERMELSRAVEFAIVIAALLLPCVPMSLKQGPSGGAKARRFSDSPGTANEQPVPRKEYVGDEKCAHCHQEIFDSYEKTAHHLTSQVANKNSIVGTFSPSTNIMHTSRPDLGFRMDLKGDQFFQTAIWGTPPNERTHTQRFDLVVGSGRNGQTYLFWDESQLFQLPVGYSTVLRRWINSPGYVDGTASFGRGIIPRCLECHAAYFESQFPDPDSNFYNTKNFVLGISCERCHGPGRGHVQSHEEQTQSSKSGAAMQEMPIVNPAKLSRQLQAEVCAQCHAGPGYRELRPAFSYVPGKPLEDYIDLGSDDATKDIDVHGKQVKLLMKSRCFQASKNMTCSTCHDVHRVQRDLAAFSQRCLTCHDGENMVRHASLTADSTNNCVDCHMPTLETKVVELDVNGKKVRPRLRTHWIRIYSESERQ